MDIVHRPYRKFPKQSAPFEFDFLAFIKKEELWKAPLSSSSY